MCKMKWLEPLNVNHAARISISDFHKRKEILLEFIYYVFDSLLIPLVRSNFHVTESSSHQNRLFFFRHDVWRQLTESPLNSLKISMFEEMKTVRAEKLLDSRALGYGQLRLLPKSSGVRPIMNLRKRATRLRGGKLLLGRGINKVMEPVFNMLDYEKKKQPSRIGSALFSVGDIYPKLKAFRLHLQSLNVHSEKFYFVKGDVQSCFDTIPQRTLIELIENITTEHEYKIARYSEIKASKAQGGNFKIRRRCRPVKKFLAPARAPNDFQTFEQVTKDHYAVGKKNTVFVDSVVYTSQKRDTLLDLLEEHIERNVVKIGKKFFRQKAGIPQGSVLSSLLCNYFYAHLEQEYLSFLKPSESVLLRLIDDFLLITNNREHADRFLQTMNQGVEKYGVKFNSTKSLTNFEAILDGRQIPRLDGSRGFPYCGSMIDTRTLEITKDRDRRKNTSRFINEKVSILIAADDHQSCRIL